MKHVKDAVSLNLSFLTNYYKEAENFGNMCPCRVLKNIIYMRSSFFCVSNLNRVPSNRNIRKLWPDQNKIRYQKAAYGAGEQFALNNGTMDVGWKGIIMVRKIKLQ